mmetsp:Transcript_17892/g.57263  ORF Transcript_17892/g.57263 Transcript_17892/m.57263 type:complete len:205 (+) Transcript_17892:404-1018(+)
MVCSCWRAAPPSWCPVWPSSDASERGLADQSPAVDALRLRHRVQCIQRRPPVEQLVLRNQAEPGGELVPSRLRVAQNVAQLVRAHVLDLGHLVGVGLHLQIRLASKQDVVHLMLAPSIVARSLVVHLGQERQVLLAHRTRRYAQLLSQLAHRRALHSQLIPVLKLAFRRQRVAMREQTGQVHVRVDAGPLPPTCSTCWPTRAGT